MNIQDFVGEIVFSKTDGKGRIEKVIWGKTHILKWYLGTEHKRYTEFQGRSYQGY